MKTDAIKQWNTRATPTPTEARERIAERIVEFARGRTRSIRLTRDVGPYEITEPTPAALEFANAILALLPDAAAIRAAHFEEVAKIAERYIVRPTGLRTAKEEAISKTVEQIAAAIRGGRS